MDFLDISICDDEKNVHDICTEILVDYYERTIELGIKHYYEAETIIKEAADQRVILMDIDMPGIDGIQASKELHELNPYAAIIMLTSKTERFKEAFVIGATRFVTKPIDKKELIEAVENARRSTKEYKRVPVTMNGITSKLDQRKIYCIESEKNDLIIRLRDKDIRIRGPLKRIRNILDDEIFLSVHKNFIINMMHVKGFRNGDIILGNDFIVPVPARKRKDIRERVIEFDLNRK